MSKVAPTKRKASSRSSTESSSGSSSDSSSSSSSSSGSDSSSSSDSDSSTSQGSAKQSNPDQQSSKKSAPIKNVPRKSADTKTPPNKSKSKPPPANKPQKSPPKASTLYSSEDDSPKSNNKAKKKPLAKAIKASTSSNVKNPPKVTGGKVPPKSNPAAKAQQAKLKENAKTKVLQKNATKIDPNKKKSIFSPENSSESDSNEKPVAKTQALKATAVKPRAKASAKPIEPKKTLNKKENKPKSKEMLSTASSSQSSSESSSSSESESSDSGSDSNKKTTPKKQVRKSSTAVKEDQNSDSDEGSKDVKQTPRKSTRTSNTRKSKHVVGKNVFTDTDSDTESTKRSLSRSPVKKAPIATKGKAKNKKTEASKRVEVVIAEDRKCPLEECNSSGHLGGRLDKHFTIDACPLYHNMAASKCADNCQERKKREEARKKLIEGSKKSPRGALPTPEQKVYAQKIKDSRNNFKSESADEGKVITERTLEPNLDYFVPECDLKLFRDAQAISSEKIEEELKTLPNTKGTKYIEMGKFEMEVWYQSPYPEEYARLPKLYICEYCLRYMRGRIVLQRHAAKCVWRHPPGEEVYRKDKISVWEVDGKRYKQFCQNLCLLAKFFLDHKTLYFDVEPFLFYVMTMSDQEGCHTVGYFSKEKNSFLNYNVSCILTLPPYQRQGYGRLLIDFSYLLTRVEGKIGSPEKPLSDLGLISYRSYWKDVLLSYLCARAGTQLSIKDMSQEMAIHSTDIVSTLQALGMMKYWKGKHIILKKQDVLDEYAERVKRRGSLLKEVDKSCLRWTPFVPPQPPPT